MECFYVKYQLYTSYKPVINPGGQIYNCFVSINLITFYDYYMLKIKCIISCHIVLKKTLTKNYLLIHLFYQEIEVFIWLFCIYKRIKHFKSPSIVLYHFQSIFDRFCYLNNDYDFSIWFSTVHFLKYITQHLIIFLIQSYLVVSKQQTK